MREARAQHPRADLDEESTRRRVGEVQGAWYAMVEAVAALSIEDQTRFERELSNAINDGIKRRVERLDNEAADGEE